MLRTAASREPIVAIGQVAWRAITSFHVRIGSSQADGALAMPNGDWRRKNVINGHLGVTKGSLGAFTCRAEIASRRRRARGKSNRSNETRFKPLERRRAARSSRRFLGDSSHSRQPNQSLRYLSCVTAENRHAVNGAPSANAHPTRSGARGTSWLDGSRRPGACKTAAPRLLLDRERTFSAAAGPAQK